MSKSIAHVIQYASFQLNRAYSSGETGKWCQTYKQTKSVFIHQTMCISKIIFTKQVLQQRHFFIDLLKSDSHLQKNLPHLLQWKPFKMMKNDFCFILRVLSVLKIFRFLSWLFGHIQKTTFSRKIMLISKFVTSRPCSQTITIHILPNISLSKGNQIIKFGQLIECNKINIFLQKSCRKWGRETSSMPRFVFLKSFILDKSKCFAALNIFW